MSSIGSEEVVMLAIQATNFRWLMQRRIDACEKCHIGGPEHSQLDTSERSIFGEGAKACAVMA